MGQNIIHEFLSEAPVRSCFAFTDGLCLENPGPCGAGADIFFSDHPSGLEVRTDQIGSGERVYSLVPTYSHTYATCMTDSVDGKYIFIGLPCGLVALDALAQNFLGSWEEEGAEVTYIQSYH